jgi:membrane-associated phospholipid phosphatase
MNGPRDHSAEATVGTIRFARTFSNIVSPPVIFAVLGLALSLDEEGLWPGFLWAAVFGFFVSLAPILFILFMMRIGRITDLHMNTRQERYLPYLVSVTTSAFVLLLIYLLDGPELLSCLTILNLIVLIILAAVNAFWLISIHTASVSAATIIFGLVFGWWAAVVFSPFLIGVCWARLYLRRHTPGQVVAGLLLGLVGTLTLAALGCFI